MVCMVKDPITERLKNNPNTERPMLFYRPFRIRVVFFKELHNWVLYHRRHKCEMIDSQCETITFLFVPSPIIFMKIYLQYKNFLGIQDFSLQCMYSYEKNCKKERSLPMWGPFHIWVPCHLHTICIHAFQFSHCANSSLPNVHTCRIRRNLVLGISQTPWRFLFSFYLVLLTLCHNFYNLPCVDAYVYVCT
jgi:hypothetical protein